MNHRKEELQFKKQINSLLVRHKAYLRPLYQGKLTISSDIEDSQYSFDMIFNLKINVSVRIRKSEYLKYADFTIRTRSKNGFTTEIDKLINGYGQLYFYCWMNNNQDKIQEYILVDINKIRQYLKEHGTERNNNDGTKFKAYSIDWLINHDALVFNSFNKQFILKL